MQTLQHIPLWVFALLMGLITLGLLQTRPPPAAKLERRHGHQRFVWPVLWCAQCTGLALVEARVHGMSAGGVTHIGMILDSPAVTAVLQACRD
jgi:hypothetical protein